MDPSVVESVKKISEQHNAPFAVIGQVDGKGFVVSIDGDEVVNTDITDLESAWRNALSRKLQAEVPATV